MAEQNETHQVILSLESVKLVIFVQEAYLNFYNYDAVLQPETKQINKYSLNISQNTSALKFPFTEV